MAKTKKSEEAKLQEKIDKTAKLFDVAQPGKTPAAATSRPIIVGHGGGIARDPMMAPEKDGGDETPSDKPMSHASLKLPSDKKPLAVPTHSHHEKIEPKPKPVEVVAKPELVESKPAEEPEPPKKDVSSPVVDTLMSEVDSKQADKKQKQDLDSQIEAVEKLIATKEYFVPIGEQSRRRSHHRIVAAVVLIVVIGLAGVNFGIDAEIIDIGVSAVTDIL